MASSAAGKRVLRQNAGSFADREQTIPEGRTAGDEIRAGDLPGKRRARREELCEEHEW